MGKNSRKSKKKKYQRQDWRGENTMDVADVEGEQVPKDLRRKLAKKSRHEARNEKTKRSRQAGTQLSIRKGILNALNAAGEENDDDHKVKSTSKASKWKRLQRNGNGDTSIWHKITICRAAEYPKELVMTALANATDVTFVPICFSVKNDKDFTFYLESAAAVKAVKACHLETLFQDPADGRQVRLEVKAVASGSPPQQPIEGKVAETLRRVMGSPQRFRPELQAMDLKSFHSDPEFLLQSIYAPLSRSVVMDAVVNVIAENVPQLRAVDLSNNKLPTLHGFKTLAERAPGIKVLHLSNNRLSNVKELEKISSLRLEELNLNGNVVLTSRFDSEAELSSAVQNVFPSLKVLDGRRLIAFDDEDAREEVAAILPAPIKKLCEGEVVLRFVEEYFKAFDSGDRRCLMPAYHEEALFSMSAAPPPGCSAQGPSRLTGYQVDARNLVLLKNKSKRNKLLKQGRQDVIDYLSDDLPTTEHDFASFCLDVTLATEAVASFTVTGVFRERTMARPLRHFSRSFVIVTLGTGYVIANEMLFVTLPTALQAKSSFVAGEVSAAQRVEDLSKKTNMKVEWARKCLEQTNWDLEAAFSAFVNAKNDGRIPPEAYLP